MYEESKLHGKVLVAQGGGPTAVINQSMAGVVLFIVMGRRMPKLFNMNFMHSLFRMIFAATVAGVVCYMAVRILPFRELDDSFYSAFPRFLVISTISFLAYAVMSKILALEEIDPVIRRVKQVMFARLS